MRKCLTIAAGNLDFEYQVIRLWELPVETLLEAGIGLLPLAPLANIGADDLPRVVELMAGRFRDELPPAVAAELWTATDILMGVKFGVEQTDLVLRAVRDVMKDSPTYQAILEEGVEKGIAQGREDG
ncbi:MAG: hypothetical protein IT428_03175, partial [Planctomycetaceae bacterium]|nr:hypothetical protein [Planctomycetaceae bacterium]